MRVFVLVPVFMRVRMILIVRMLVAMPVRVRMTVSRTRNRVLMFVFMIVPVLVLVSVRVAHLCRLLAGQTASALIAHNFYSISKDANSISRPDRKSLLGV